MSSVVTHWQLDSTIYYKPFDRALIGMTLCNTNTQWYSNLYLTERNYRNTAWQIHYRKQLKLISGTLGQSLYITAAGDISLKGPSRPSAVIMSYIHSSIILHWWFKKSPSFLRSVPWCVGRHQLISLKALFSTYFTLSLLLNLGGRGWKLMLFTTHLMNSHITLGLWWDVM